MKVTQKESSGGWTSMTRALLSMKATIINKSVNQQSFAGDWGSRILY